MSSDTRTLVLLRHGESLWNRENRFTGWKDVDLSPQGVIEATEAGRLLGAEGLEFDCAYTSCLKRAIRTLWLVLGELRCEWLPTTVSWRLNERHYGALEGLNKAETTARYGEEQVKIWRRSFRTRPPAITRDDPRFPGFDRRYSAVAEGELPLAESLADVIQRVEPLWKTMIAPDLEAGRRVLIAAHGNTIRALVMKLSGISEEDITELNIPTGVPLVYTLDRNNAELSRRYIGDQEKIRAAEAAVAAQARKV